MVTNRNKFIDDLIDAGADDDEISEALQLAESRNEFESTQPSQPERQPEKKDKNLFLLPDNFEKAVFPTFGVQATGERKKGIGGLLQAGGAAVDALNTPVRALGMTRGYSMDDPNSALLRPEIEKTKDAIDKLPSVDTKKYHLPQMGNPLGGMKVNRVEAADYREPLKGATEITGTMLSDPLFVTGLLKNVIAKPLKGAATKIEASVLGKGNKSILKKNRLTSTKAAENALEENVGGNLKGTINKVADRLEDIEDNIQNMLSESVKSNPGLSVDVDNVIDNLKANIDAGKYKDLYGMSDDVKNQLDILKNENSKFGYAGQLQVDKANELKRLVGKKAFKKGIPTTETAPKEMAYDLLNLELKDEIEKIVPAIKDQNAVYKKLIPIKQMAENRLPTLESNDILGLGRLGSAGVGAVAGGISPLSLIPIGAYEASKSGTVAQGLYNASKGFQNLPFAELSALSNSLNAGINKNRKNTNERTKQ